MCELVKIRSNTGEIIDVASIKAYIIQKIIDYASLCKKIEYVYLFGSSLEERCTEKSDIDIALISDVSMSKLVRDKGYNMFKKCLYDIDEEQDYDLLYFRSLLQLQNSKEFVCKDIVNKGKIIYKKE